MDIKEIALRIGEEADEYADAKLQSKGEFHPDWHTVRDEYFAEALLAELAKGNEPVAWCSLYSDGTLNWLQRYEDKNHRVGLYLIPPTALQIEQETAEAIAKMLDSNPLDRPASQKIRSGAWKEFK